MFISDSYWTFATLLVLTDLYVKHSLTLCYTAARLNVRGNKNTGIGSSCVYNIFLNFTGGVGNEKQAVEICG